MNKNKWCLFVCCLFFVIAFLVKTISLVKKGFKSGRPNNLWKRLVLQLGMIIWQIFRARRCFFFRKHRFAVCHYNLTDFSSAAHRQKQLSKELVKTTHFLAASCNNSKLRLTKVSKCCSLVPLEFKVASSWLTSSISDSLHQPRHLSSRIKKNCLGIGCWIRWAR